MGVLYQWSTRQEHLLLGRRVELEEAEIVAGAGQSGVVTVSTSMAGRGTDIKLSEATRAAGGLHVIITELHDASRIDRQLAGRGARQGDPGLASEVLSLEDRLVKKMSGALQRKFIATAMRTGMPLPNWMGLLIQRNNQQD